MSDLDPIIDDLKKSYERYSGKYAALREAQKHAEAYNALSSIGAIAALLVAIGALWASDRLTAPALVGACLVVGAVKLALNVRLSLWEDREIKRIDAEFPK